ncbi:MAG: PIN domain nuclease [Tessaracoccus sp.]
MRLVFDAGALIALERGEPEMWRRWAVATRGDRRPPVTHGGVIGQVWRGGPRQARLARALPGLDVVALDERLGRAAGELMRSAATADVVDAALIALSVDGDVVYTSDVGDLEHLAAVGGVEIQIVRV